MMATDTHRAVDAIFRIEQAKLIAGLARIPSSWRRTRSWPLLSSGLSDRRQLLGEILDRALYDVRSF
jgi:hypothetical protein